MLDIAFIQDNPDIVKKALKDRCCDVSISVDDLLVRYKKMRQLKQETDEIRRQQNEASAERDINRGRELKEQLKKKEEVLREVSTTIRDTLASIPNIPSPDTPVGKDESDNVVIRTVGTPPSFSFIPKEHDVLGKELGIIDTERAAKVSGSRFTYLKGGAALMQVGLIAFVFKTLMQRDVLEQIATKAGLSVSSKPFIPIIPPTLIRPEMLFGMARLEPRADRFFIDSDNLFLTGSAEHSLGAMFADETLVAEEAPYRFIGYSTAYRREAGSYGKDTRGIIRQHQFDKLEMESFTAPQDSRLEHEFMVAIQEYLVGQLDIHYRVVAVCTGDMGDPDTKQTDIEMWMPGQGVFRETHSADLTGSYQARRLGIRMRNKDGTQDTVHMNDATAFAIGRTLVAILENYQQEDGSVRVPSVLQEFVGSTVIRPA